MERLSTHPAPSSPTPPSVANDQALSSSIPTTAPVTSPLTPAPQLETFDSTTLERLANMISSRMSAKVRALSDSLDVFQNEMRARLTALE